MAEKKFTFKSAKNVKKAERRRFGTEKWWLYDAVSQDLDTRSDSFQVPLSEWEERRNKLNETRKKKLPDATLQNFKVNLTAALLKIRKERDFEISEAADQQNLIVEKK